VLHPLLGGGHELMYFEANPVRRVDQLMDRATAGDFTRGVVDGRHGGFFAQPRALGCVPMVKVRPGLLDPRPPAGGGAAADRAVPPQHLRRGAGRRAPCAGRRGVRPRRAAASRDGLGGGAPGAGLASRIAPARPRVRQGARAGR
jgi:hypothetical protein